MASGGGALPSDRSSAASSSRIEPPADPAPAPLPASRRASWSRMRAFSLSSRARSASSRVAYRRGSSSASRSRACSSAFSSVLFPKIQNG